MNSNSIYKLAKANLTMTDKWRAQGLSEAHIKKLKDLEMIKAKVRNKRRRLAGLTKT